MAARRQPMEAAMQMLTIKVINGYSFHIAGKPSFSLHFLILLECNYLATDFKSRKFVTYLFFYYLFFWRK
jgi:hypothetical protein